MLRYFVWSYHIVLVHFKVSCSIILMSIGVYFTISHLNTTVHYTTLHCLTWHYNTLCHIALYYITLHCIAFHYNTYITIQYWYQTWKKTQHQIAPTSNTQTWHLHLVTSKQASVDGSWNLGSKFFNLSAIFKAARWSSHRNRNKRGGQTSVWDLRRPTAMMQRCYLKQMFFFIDFVVARIQGS